MTSNYDVSTNLEIFYFYIFDDYEANIAPISTNFFLFSYKFSMLFSFFKQTGCFRPPILRQWHLNLKNLQNFQYDFVSKFPTSLLLQM